MKKIIISIALLFSFFVMSNLVYAVNDNDRNIRICHKNEGINGYSSILVDDASVDGEGGGDHNQDGHQDGQDIIPPGSYDADGRNWNAAGILIWNNDCNGNAVTNTPTPTTGENNPTPTITRDDPTPTIVTPTDILCPTYANNCEIGNIDIPPCLFNCPTSTPTPTLTPEPTATPTPVNPTATPQPGSTNAGIGGGSSDSSSSSAPAAGQVLGATTLPATGTFADSLMDALLIVGLAILVLGSRKVYAPAKIN